MKQWLKDWGWAKILLLVIGITLMVIGSLRDSNPANIEFLGSLCSILALLWVIMDNRLNRLRQETRGMREEITEVREGIEEVRKGIEEMRKGIEEIRKGIEETREDLERLPRRIAEELKGLLGK